MIITIRGTSGSGKSHIVRELMKRLDPLTPNRREGRKQPLSYTGHNPLTGKPVTIIGHYETACGGCDTITQQQDIFDLVHEAATAGHDVIFEGLLLSIEVERTTKLVREHGHELVVLGIDIPLQLCLDSVNARRRQKDPTKPPVNPKNTEAKWRQCKSSWVRLKQRGIECRIGDRAFVLANARQLLGL